ncbi:MAG: polysaccharide biosynthesis tyrosine autokinase [Arachnia sp.]
MVAYWFGRVTVTAFGFRRIVSVVAWVFPPIAIVLIFESFSGLNPWQAYLPLDNFQFTQHVDQQLRGGVVRAEGPYGHSIAAGSALAVMAVLTLDARMRSWVRVVLIVFSGAGILVTLSRISLVTLVLGVVLTLVFARTSLTRVAKGWILGTFAVFGAVGYSLLQGVFAESGAEASNSASYRIWLLDLVGTLRPVGYATAFERATSGATSFGGFRSIDNAVLFYALTNGWIPALVLIVLIVPAGIRLLRRRGGVGTAVLLAQVPALFSVALITSYSYVFWFSAGLAATEILATSTKKSGFLRSRRIPADSFYHLQEEQHMFERLSLATLMRRWKLIVAVALLGGVAAFAASALTTPLYRSTASLFVTLSFGNTASDMAQGTTYTANQMTSFGALVTSPVVLNPVIEELGLRTTAADLAQAVSVSTPRDTVVIEIRAVDASPERSANIANAVASQTATAIENFAPSTESGRASVQVKTMAEATAPTFAYSPNKKINSAVGLVIGALVAILGVLLVALMDHRVRDVDSVAEVADVALLGSLRQREDASGDGAVVLQEPSSSAAEEYRQLRSNLMYASMRKRPLVVAVASGSPHEGKTTVATNLAAAIAESEQRVLLVDADLRRPLVAQYAQVPDGVGLADVLVGEVSFEDAVFTVGANGMDVLPGGSVPPNPGELLASSQMIDLVEQAKQRYDVIVVDTAPILAVADALSLTQLAGGLVLVVRAGSTTKADLARSLNSVRSAGCQVFGVVVNGVKDRSSSALKGYSSHSSPEATKGGQVAAHGRQGER